MVAAFGLDVMPLVASVPADYSRTGNLLILMFLFAFARIRLVWAIATAPLVVAGYAAFQTINATPRGEAAYNGVFLLSFVVIGVSTSYTLERLRRLEFVRQRRVGQ